jgi:hypothetical protein
MGKVERKIAERYAELTVKHSPRHVTPTGEQRPDGERPLGCKVRTRRSSSVHENAV